MKEEITRTVNSMKRFRNESLTQHFTSAQIEFISTVQGDSFKEKMLRASGFGLCKHCSNNTPYKRNIKFDEFCSSTCQIQYRNSNSRTKKFDLLSGLLQVKSIVIKNPQQYKNVNSLLQYTCNSCQTDFSGITRTAFNHQCKVLKTVLIKQKAAKQIKKPAVSKKLSVTCAQCKCLKSKSKSAICKNCFIQSRRKSTGEKHEQQLRDLGFSFKDQQFWDNHSNAEVTNLQCGHTFTAKLGNILTGATRCGICGPKLRAEKLKTAFLKKYSRTYDLKSAEEYASYVRRKSDTNWKQAGLSSITRGRTAMHLDHKVPVMFGFKNKIPPDALADLENLQLLDFKQNISKSDKSPCYDTLRILAEKYDFSFQGDILGKIGTNRTNKIKSLLNRPMIQEDNNIFKVNDKLSLGIITFDQPISAGDLISRIKSEDYFLVYEDELLGRQKRIIESMINHADGLSERIFARKCEIREITGMELSRFLNANHLSGALNSSVRLGLFYNDSLVSVMGFCKSRFLKTFEWEMTRFANKLDISVIGGTSKLLSYFIRNYSPKSIMTYTDKRFGKNNVYEKIGMSHVKNTQPSVWWVKDSVRINSQDTRPEKVKKYVERYDELLGVETNMIRNGWLKIEDIGSAVYAWTNPTDC